MSLIEAILLGALQGITEFLPVSSSGHLAIASSFIDGLDRTNMLYETLLHCATMLAIIIYFRKRIGLIIKAFFGIFIKKYQLTYFENKRFLWGIIIASIPTAIIGLLLESIAISFLQTTLAVGYSLIITSIILVISDRYSPKGKLTASKSLVIGIVQGISVLPGISRSGSTIVASVLLGVNREEAAEFSFLISLPAIFGATLLQLRDVSVSSVPYLQNYIIGMIVAFFVAFISISFMLYFVRTAKLTYFAIYCLILGIITVIFL